MYFGHCEITIINYVWYLKIYIIIFATVEIFKNNYLTYKYY